MELKEMFELSPAMMGQLDLAMENLSENAKSSEVNASYGCVCCGGGWCATGIAGD